MSTIILLFPLFFYYFHDYSIFPRLFYYFHDYSIILIFYFPEFSTSVIFLLSDARVLRLPLFQVIIDSRHFNQVVGCGW